VNCVFIFCFFVLFCFIHYSHLPPNIFSVTSTYTAPTAPVHERLFLAGRESMRKTETMREEQERAAVEAAAPSITPRARALPKRSPGDLLEWARVREERLAARRTQRDLDEVQSLSFSPKINSHSRKLVEAKTELSVVGFFCFGNFVYPFLDSRLPHFVFCNNRLMEY
jgi:hypothetical protein